MEKQIMEEQNNTTTTNPTAEVVTTMVKNNIKGFIRWGIIISSMLMSITFIISWVLWLTLFPKSINEIITIINTVITNNGINFNLTFQTLTITVLSFALITLGVTTVPFIFLKKKSITTLILGILMLVISAVLITGSTLFGTYGFCAFYNYVLSKNNIVDILFIAIPAGLELLYCVILVIFCILLIFTSFKNKNKEFELVIPSINEVKENDSLSIQGASPFLKTSSKPIAFVEPTVKTKNLQTTDVNSQSSLNNPAAQQGINIVITNNNAFPPTPQSSPTGVIPPFSTAGQQEFHQNSIPTGEIIWSVQQIEDVWNKAEISKNFNPSLYRKDYAGALIYKNSFVNSVRLNDVVKSFNWTIVHQKPLSVGGVNDISNLVPLNNSNAISKANNYPKWKTTVTYNGKENIAKEKSWKGKK